jgi:hypothetical protein
MMELLGISRLGCRQNGGAAYFGVLLFTQEKE